MNICCGTSVGVFLSKVEALVSGHRREAENVSETAVCRLREYVNTEVVWEFTKHYFAKATVT